VWNAQLTELTTHDVAALSTCFDLVNTVYEQSFQDGQQAADQSGAPVAASASASGVDAGHKQQPQSTAMTN
jgi:hypothetical protein